MWRSILKPRNVPGGRRIWHMQHAFTLMTSSSLDEIIDDGPLSSLSSSSRHQTQENPSSHQRKEMRGYSYQRGSGKIVALSSQSSPSAPVSTYLTDLRHSSPMRLVPSRRSHPTNKLKRRGRQHEAALVHLSSYGGGLVPGDSLHLDVDVRGRGAIVCILTQGGQRIYRPGEHFRMYDSYSHDAVAATPLNDTEKRRGEVSSSKLCKSTIRCRIEPGGTLLYLPDPTVPYYQSAFRERREFTCLFAGTQSGHTEKEDIPSMGSVVAVDWYSSGRRFSTGMEEERWAFDYLATRTELFVVEQDQTKPEVEMQRNRPDFIESMSLNNASSEAKKLKTRTPAAIALGQNLDAMATLLLHGPTSLAVAKRTKSLSRHLVGACTRTRITFDDEPDDLGGDGISDGRAAEVEELEKLMGALGGKVIVSTTPIERDKGYSHKGQFGRQPLTHLVRILAERNEDIYRILHHCLKPCSQYLGGLEPYLERIHSSRTASCKLMPAKKHADNSILIARQNQQGDGDVKKKRDLNSVANHLVFGNHLQESSFSIDAWFRLSALSDSALPVGSFAHSLGTEAASQIGIFNPEENDTTSNANGKKPWKTNDGTSRHSSETLSDYIYAGSRSNARFSAPLILAAYSVFAPLSSMNLNSSLEMNVKCIHRSWIDIDAYVDTLLLGNDPGRRASIDQGLGLLRVVPSFVDIHDSVNHNREIELWELIRGSIDHHDNASIDTPVRSRDCFAASTFANGHAAPIHGILSASLGIAPLDACRVFAFGAARDIVSAAVRLNLVGPMAGLSILDGVGRNAVEEGLEEGLASMLQSSLKGRAGGDCVTREAQLEHWLHSVSTCAPLLDTIQPLHDLLSVRLFRT